MLSCIIEDVLRNIIYKMNLTPTTEVELTLL